MVRFMHFKSLFSFKCFDGLVVKRVLRFGGNRDLEFLLARTLSCELAAILNLGQIWHKIQFFYKKWTANKYYFL